MIWNVRKECLSADEREAVQLKRLQNMLGSVKGAVPHYRRALTDVEPQDLKSMAELARLPFTVKDDLREIPAKVKNTPKWKFAELPRQACSRRRTEGILPDGAEVAPGLRCVLNLRG